ncbi:MAG: biosynthetic-type acetolactate synthase large subunit [Clostridia bacterium]|nr:biosynthetic-type acetolactate synthase large subunit [Clostridia bacterium]
MKKNAKNRMTGAQIAIETLIEQGVTELFGYPGGTVLDLYDALYRSRGRIRHILTAHEQGAAHAADGYARATGKVGVVLATSGPGATNLVTGLATAMLDSVPVVAITGNVPTYLIGKDAFQEINITGITLPITKHNYFVQDVRELADTIREAFQIAKSGRPGPVLIDIPKDIQIATCPFTPQPVVSAFPQPKLSDAQIDQVVDLLSKAQRPYLYIGGGAARCELGAQLMALSEKLDGYIGCSLMGLSEIPHSFDRFLGMEGMHGAYASTMANLQADLILGVGVRFSDRATGDPAKFCKDAVIIQLDADQSEINKNVKVTLGLVGDLRDAVDRILSRVAQQSHPAWNKTVEALQEEQRRLAQQQPSVPAGMDPRDLFAVINRLKDDETLIATDVGQHQMWTAQNIQLARPRSFLSSGGLGTMGFGLGAAIGGAVGTGKRVILLTGDGSFGMNLNELATAVSCQLPIVIILFNNSALGMVRQLQTFFFGRRYAGTNLQRETDFVKLAQAFGADGARVSDIAAFESALKNALKQKTPYLIEVQIDRDACVLPMLPKSGLMEDMITELDGEDTK